MADDRKIDRGIYFDPRTNRFTYSFKFNKGDNPYLIERIENNLKLKVTPVELTEELLNQYPLLHVDKRKLDLAEVNKIFTRTNKLLQDLANLGYDVVGLITRVVNGLRLLGVQNALEVNPLYVALILQRILEARLKYLGQRRFSQMAEEVDSLINIEVIFGDTEIFKLAEFETSPYEDTDQEKRMKEKYIETMQEVERRKALFRSISTRGQPPRVSFPTSRHGPQISRPRRKQGSFMGSSNVIDESMVAVAGAYEGSVDSSESGSLPLTPRELEPQIPYEGLPRFGTTYEKGDLDKAFSEFPWESPIRILPEVNLLKSAVGAGALGLGLFGYSKLASTFSEPKPSPVPPAFNPAYIDPNGPPLVNQPPVNPHGNPGIYNSAYKFIMNAAAKAIGRQSSAPVQVVQQQKTRHVFPPFDLSISGPDRSKNTYGSFHPIPRNKPAPEIITTEQINDIRRQYI